jgi:hypothetical protein
VERLSLWSTSADRDDERLTLTVPSRDVLPDILRNLIRLGADVYECTPRPMSLEELFVSIMGKDAGL